MSALLGLVLAITTVTVEGAQRDARSVFEADRYEFCHDTSYPLATSEHAWCPIVGAESATCPALPAICKNEPVPDERVSGGPGGFGSDRKGESSTGRRRLSWRVREHVEGKGDARYGDARGGRDGRDHDPRRSARGRDGKGDRGKWSDRGSSRDRDARTEPRPERQTVAVPGLGGLGQLLFYAILAGFVIAVVRAIAKNVLLDREAAADGEPEAERPDEAASAAAKPRGPVETDVDRLLARARALAARGDYAKAVDDVYAALLRRLDGDGLIDIHPSRTNGDYLRALRENAELRRAVREVFVDVERVQFGATPPSEPVFRAILGRVAPLVGRTLIALLFGLGLGATLSCAPHTPSQTTSSSVGDTSPSGTQAIIDLLGKHDINVRHRSQDLDDLGEHRTIVVLSGAEIDDAGWARLLDWVDAKRGTLIIAGAHPLPARLEIQTRPATGTTPVVQIDSELGWRFGTQHLSLPPDGEISPSEDDSQDLLIRGDASYAVRVKGAADPREGGEIYVFADDWLFTNIAMTVPENASFLASFLGSLPPRVELVDSWTGVGADTPFEAVARANLLPIILQLLLLMLLYGLYKGAHFADPRDPPLRSRRAFADHARALGLAYARARASRHAVAAYATWALDRLRERVLRGGRQGLVPLAEAIGARTGRSEAEVMSVLVEAASAREETSPTSFRPSLRGGASPPRRTSAGIAEDAALMRELDAFLTAVGRASPNAARPAEPPKDAPPEPRPEAPKSS